MKRLLKSTVLMVLITVLTGTALYAQTRTVIDGRVMNGSSGKAGAIIDISLRRNNGNPNFVSVATTHSTSEGWWIYHLNSEEFPPTMFDTIRINVKFCSHLTTNIEITEDYTLAPMDFGVVDFATSGGALLTCPTCQNSPPIIRSP